MIKSEALVKKSGVFGFLKAKKEWKLVTVLNDIANDDIIKESESTTLLTKSMCQYYRQAPTFVEFKIIISNNDEIDHFSKYFNHLIDKSNMKWKGIQINNIIKNAQLDLFIDGAGNKEIQSDLESIIRRKFS